MVYPTWCRNRYAVKQMCLLYLLTFFVILPIFCYKLHFSVYNFYNMDSKEGREQLMTENKFRLMSTRQYEQILKNIYSVQNEKAANKRVDLAITVITTARNQQNLENYQPLYLTQVVWKLLWLLNEAKRSGFKPHVLLSVCNVDIRPDSHQEAIDLLPIIPVINKYENGYHSTHSNIFEKEKQDYVFCLNSSVIHDPKFVLLVEDDAYPNDDLFVVLDHVFHTRFHLQMTDLSFKQHYQDQSRNNVTYVKLYHPERLLGYISLEPDRLTELFGTSVLFGTLLMILYMHTSKKLKRFQSNMMWVCLVVYVALVAMAIGRPHLLELRRLFSPYLYSYMNAPECCTPAMLFPIDGALEVISHLNSHLCYARNAKDAVLDRYIVNEHRHAHIVQPNLFKHIGLFSSLREKFLNPYVVK